MNHCQQLHNTTYILQNWEIAHAITERERERSKRKRENETHSEIQGAGDTVNKYNQEHTTKTNKGHNKM